MALSVAGLAREYFIDGVLFVSLASLFDPTLVIPTIAQEMGLKETGSQSWMEVLRKVFHEKRLLLFLDNFEQVHGAARQLADLLTSCPSVKALVTSRIALQLRGEEIYTVQPFHVEDTPRTFDLSTVIQRPAVALFRQRAQASVPDFQLHETTVAAVIAVCRHLHGIPLFIELAASHSSLFSPHALLNSLGKWLPLLQNAAQDAPQRQQSLRNTLVWDYSLLSKEAQQLFRFLVPFRGGFTLEDVENLYLSLDISSSKLNASLEELLRFYLVQKAPNWPSRLVMIDIIHEYAKEELTKNREAEDVYQAHAICYLALAEKAEPALLQKDQHSWIAMLQQKLDNLRATFDWFKARNDKERALRLCSALWRFWLVSGQLSEGNTRLQEAFTITLQDSYPLPVRAKALTAAGAFALVRGDFKAANDFYTESVALYQGEDQCAGLVPALNGLGMVMVYRKSYDKAQTIFEKKLTVAQKCDDLWGIAEAWFMIGIVALHQKNYSLARKRLIQALNAAEQLQDRYGLAYVLGTLGQVALHENQYQEAYDWYVKGLAISIDMNDYLGMSTFLDGLGEVIAAQGDFIWATRTWGAAESLRTLTGVSPFLFILQNTYERFLIRVQKRLGQKAFYQAWAEGQQITPQQVLDAKKDLPSPVTNQGALSSTPLAVDHFYHLTPREQEILHLLTDSKAYKTYKEIADILHVQPRTVSTHVSSIYRKLGVKNRYEAIPYARDQHSLGIRSE